MEFLPPLPTTPLFAFTAGILAHVAALYVFPHIGLLDFPERYGLTRKRLPYPSGVLVVILFIAIFPLAQAIDRSAAGVLAAVVLLAIVSFVDDRRQLSPLLRLAAQTGAALLVFFAGDCTGGRICSVTNPLDGIVGTPFLELNGPLPILSAFFTIGWILVTVNALNWFDGVPGQTSLLSTIGFATIGFLSLSDRVNQPELALLAFILAGLAAAASIFELPLPMAKVVPGDSGAMFFGLLLGVLTIYAGGKVATGFLVLGVPLIDSVIVVVRRLLAGKNPMRGSQSGEHLHHRLLARGWSQWSVIALTTGLGTCFGVAALFFSTFEKFVAGAVLASIITALSIWSSPRPHSKT